MRKIWADTHQGCVAGRSTTIPARQNRSRVGGTNGERMRCHFRLLRRDEGMKGGAQGACQLPLGETTRAEIPPS
jgi:hypothetical protein